MSTFTDAKNYLLENGWTKGTMLREKEDGGLPSACVMGACAQVGFYPDGLHRIAFEQFPDRAQSRTTGAVDVNDHEDTTLEDVILLLEKAQAQFEEKYGV